MSHTDWHKIRQGYVEGFSVNGLRVWPTIEETAKMHGISESSVRKMSAAEAWPALRDQFCTEVERLRRSRSVEALAESGVNLDAKAVGVADALASQVQMHVDHALKSGQPLPASTLATLGRALQSAVSVGRLVRGAPTEIAEQRVDDAREQAVADDAVLHRLTDEELTMLLAARQAVARAEAEARAETGSR